MKIYVVIEMLKWSKRKATWVNLCNFPCYCTVFNDDSGDKLLVDSVTLELKIPKYVML